MKDSKHDLRSSSGHFAPHNLGAALLLALGAAALPRVYAQSDVPGFKAPIILHSPHAQRGGEFGAPVTWVPDVNGDGKADIVVSARGESSGGGLGRVYIFDGATQAFLREIKRPPGATGGSFGGQLAGIGDVNGDGRGDVVAGTSAPYEAWVFDGATGNVIYHIPTSFGAVAIPDVDGDGRPDIATSIGSPLIVVSGATGQQVARVENPTSGRGSGLADGLPKFGFSVSGIPDLNGDGRGDLIASAVFEDLPPTPDHPGGVIDAGRAYVFDGATGALLYSLTSPDARADGEFGRSVTGLPDLNGDGRGDFAVIQQGVGTLGVAPNSGRIYTYDGATGHLLSSTELIGTVNGFDYLTTVPDTSGDGITDLLEYAYNNGNPLYYIFDGATSHLLATFPGYFYSNYGNPHSGLPDVNGDGRGEVLISSTGAGGGVGQVYLYLSDTPEPVAVEQADEGVVVRLTGLSGTSYDLQESEDLVHWTTILQEKLTNSVTEFLDRGAKNKSRRFYRTRATE